MRRFNYTQKLEWSRNMTSKVISNRIKARKSKSTEQCDCKLFFRLDGACNSVVELSNWTGWYYDSTIKFNASTNEKHCELFVCGDCGTEVAFDIKQVSFTVSSFFSPRPEGCSQQFTPNGSWLTHYCCWIHWIKKDLWSRAWSISGHLHLRIGKIAHIIEQPNT